ncbi:MAG: hypothetical protein ACKOEX_03355 [Planctomycetia bacterium]
MIASAKRRRTVTRGGMAGLGSVGVDFGRMWHEWSASVLFTQVGRQSLIVTESGCGCH